MSYWKRKNADPNDIESQKPIGPVTKPFRYKFEEEVRKGTKDVQAHGEGLRKQLALEKAKLRQTLTNPAVPPAIVKANRERHQKEEQQVDLEYAENEQAKNCQRRSTLFLTSCVWGLIVMGAFGACVLVLAAIVMWISRLG